MNSYVSHEPWTQLWAQLSPLQTHQPTSPHITPHQPTTPGLMALPKGERKASWSKVMHSPPALRISSRKVVDPTNRSARNEPPSLLLANHQQQQDKSTHPRVVFLNLNRLISVDTSSVVDGRFKWSTGLAIPTTYQLPLGNHTYEPGVPRLPTTTG